MINLSVTYSNVIAPNADYPYGSAKNETTPGVLDGTPWERAGFNDFLGMMQAAVQAAGITPSGNSETARASQFVDAIINHRWYEFTNYTAGTRIVGSDGLPYRALQANGPSTTTVNPADETAPREYWLPEEQYFNDKAHPVGSIYMSSDSTDPADVLGIGEWARVQGRFIVGVSDSDNDFDNGDTGGSKDHNHTTVNAGSHSHTSNTGYAGGHNHSVSQTGWGTDGVSPSPSQAKTEGQLIVGDGTVEDAQTLDSLMGAGNQQFTSAQNNHRHSISSDGTHNHAVNSSSNLPPYIAKYVWERTA